MRTRIGAVVGIAGLLAIAIAAPASADETLKGVTAEGVAVKLTVAEFGNATSFRIAGHKVECGEGTLDNRAQTFSPLSPSDPGRFSDNSRKTERAGKYRFNSRTSIIGKENAGPWTGTYKQTTKVFERGRKVDTCTLDTTWDAA